MMNIHDIKQGLVVAGIVTQEDIALTELIAKYRYAKAYKGFDEAAFIQEVGCTQEQLDEVKMLIAVPANVGGLLQ